MEHSKDISSTEYERRIKNLERELDAERNKQEANMATKGKEEITYAQPAKVKITHTTKGDTWEVQLREKDLGKCLNGTLSAYQALKGTLEGDVPFPGDLDLTDGGGT